MSLITRCPACTTIFKVVPDQLRVSEGWVRCGQCDEVFDANAHLQTALPTEITEPEPADPQETSLPLEPPVEEGDPYDWSAGVEVEPSPLVDEHASVPDPVKPEQNPQPELPASEIFVDDLMAVSPGLAEGIDLAQPPADATPIDETVVSPAFMRGVDFAEQKIGPPRTQWVAVAGVCFLTLCLGFQWLVQERDRIAASASGLKPALVAVCAVMGCKVAPMQSIEAVVIDSSAFSKLQTDTYQLGFTLKSTALVEIAAPSLELTLTDMQDQPLVRRVFSPSDLGRVHQTLAASSEWTGSRTLILAPSPVTARITGYRLLAFYP